MQLCVSYHVGQFYDLSHNNRNYLFERLYIISVAYKEVNANLRADV